QAKASVRIKEQKPEFDAKLLPPGSNTGAAATDALGAGGGAPGPGTAPAPDRTGTALGGESAADFAARMGLDPRTWKDLAAGLADPLRLDAGLQIDFSASASLDVGLGVQVGATADLSAAGQSGSGPSGAGVAGGTLPPPPEALSPAALTAQGGLSQALAQRAAGI